MLKCIQNLGLEFMSVSQLFFLKYSLNLEVVLMNLTI